MKGISEFIATVLIIAMVVTVSTIVITWSLRFTRETSSTVENKTSSEIECRYGAIYLRNPKINTTNNNLYVEIENTGNIKLSRLKLTVSYTDNTIQNFPLCISGSKVVNCTNEEYNLTIKEGELYPFSVSVLSSDLKFLLLTTSCPNVNDRVESKFIEIVE